MSTAPITPATALRALLALSLGLPLLGFVVGVAVLTFVPSQESIFKAVTNANSEVSLHTWWSIVQLALTAALAGWLARTSPDPRLRRGLTMLAGLLVAMLLDEMMQIHEYISDELSGSMDSGVMAGWALWVVVAVPVFVAFVAVLAFLLKGLDRRVRMLLLGAAALLVVCAAGLEVLSGVFVPAGAPAWVLEVEVLLEEAGEAAAVSITAFALLLHRDRSAGTSDLTQPIPAAHRG